MKYPSLTKDELKIENQTLKRKIFDMERRMKMYIPEHVVHETEASDDKGQYITFSRNN